MIDLFDYLYYLTVSLPPFFKKYRIDSIIRVAIRYIVNFYFPIYYKLTANNLKHSIKCANCEDVIVSLTTFPSRINNVWLTIESVMRQKRKPKKIILWLSILQFPSYEELPKRLLALQKRGLEIILCDDDLKSHKKYYYTVKEYQKSTFITIDDDVFYNSFFLKTLLNIHRKHPNSIVCNHCCSISVDEKVILPYLSWENIYHYTCYDKSIMPIGMGGVLYPPHSLYKGVLDTIAIKQFCLTADDIWLNVMSRLNHTNIICTGLESLYLPVRNKNNKTLSSINCSGANDIQLDMVREYCINTYNRDPYCELFE